MDYVICSSEEEEGQITSISTFPTHISTLSYCYYPKSQFFIGDNHIPRLSDFQESSSTSRIKKKLNREVFDSGNLCRDKSFFDNKFTKQTKSSTNESKLTSPVLYKINADLKEIASFHFLKKGIDLYLDLFNKLIYQQNKENIIFIQDSVLTKINNSKIFVHFKILKNKNIIFEDSYYRVVDVYEYLEMTFEEICKEYKSTEERWYKYCGYDLLVYSSSCFKRDDKEYRFFNGLDCNKNYLAIVNYKNVSIKHVECKNYVNLDFLEDILSRDLEIGDYAYNNGNVYKIGLEGDHIPYEGINYALIK